MKIHSYHVLPEFPEKLKPLTTLAKNLWFSWNWEAVQLFIRIDAERWEKSYQNPVDMLIHLPKERINELAEDDSFIANLERVCENFSKDMERPSWYKKFLSPSGKHLVAYFSCEYGLDEGLPIYSGGLGMLSGDHLKSAGELGIPLVGVGLLYRQGYFRQYLNPDGWQQERYPENDWYHMPVTLMKNDKGEPICISVDMAGKDVKAQIWQVNVGRTELYLLDTNIPDNCEAERAITTTLYGGDREMRIRQEILLGIGGTRALKVLGLEPTAFHINEGHAAFLLLERIRVMMEEGLGFDTALQIVWASSVFTTHTPVPAGNERFDPALLQKYFHKYIESLGLKWDDFLSLGREDPTDTLEPFCMTVLALKLTAYCNGVSKLHGDVSRDMWKDLWPNLPSQEVPIKHITNGVHTRSWISHDLSDLFEKFLGPKFVERPWDFSVWDRLEKIPDAELWRMHQRRRERLVFFARKRARQQMKNRGAGETELRMAEGILDPYALTIVFARRFATYKRGTLLFSDPERLYNIVSQEKRPVQFVFAGKAHPQDNPGKEIIRSLAHYARSDQFSGSIVFLEDYDINVARYMLQGADIWLNTPRRPLEASGTSGMKAAANGALNLSILDGWWCEGYTPENGWAIGSGEIYADPEEQDYIESEALYHCLEKEIIPLFYDRDQFRIPRDWVAKMKNSMRDLGSVFNTHRMLTEYMIDFYSPASQAFTSLAENEGARAKKLSSWLTHIRNSWGQVKVLEVTQGGNDVGTTTGLDLPVEIKVELGSLSLEDVSVEVVYGSLDNKGNLETCTAAKATRIDTADSPAGVFKLHAVIPCPQSGRYGFAARVLPKHVDLAHPFLPGMIAWENGESPIKKQ
jgi:glycogen phosphorylase